MKKKTDRINLQKVSDEAGVSVATASRALGSGQKVDPYTRMRVLEAAERLGYRTAPVPPVAPKVLTAVLDLNAPGQIDELSNLDGTMVAHVQKLLFALEQASSTNGFHLVISHSEHQLNELPLSVRTCFAKGAFIIGGVFSDQYVEAIAREIPTVLVGSFVNSGNVNAVHIHYRMGTVLSVQNLYKLGHRRIAFINAPRTTNTSSEKLAGYLQSCFQLGLPIEHDLIVEYASDWEAESAVQAAQALFDRTRFTAVITGNNTLAKGVMKVARERNLRVPQDLSIVSLYNDEGGSDAQAPVISGLHVPYALLGDLAMERMRVMLEHNQPPIEIAVQPRYEPGSTVAAPNTND